MESLESVDAAFEPRIHPLRVLLAMPRPLLTLLDDEEGEWVPITDWDASEGASEVLPLHRIWKIEVVEAALRGSGTPMAVHVLYHPTYDNLRLALDEGYEYDVVIVDTHGDAGGKLYFEGPYGESRPVPMSEIGELLAMGGVRLAVLSARYPGAASQALHEAGIPAVVGMSETVREDAARSYLSTFLGRLARGDRLDDAHEQGCNVLRERWGERLGEDELPQLADLAGLERSVLVNPDVEGTYTRLREPPAGPRPPVLPIRLRGRAIDQVVVQSKLLSNPPAEGASPLVTLHGFGGAGKTALIKAVAYWCWERAVFSGGVHFVHLPRMHTGAEMLVDHLLRTLGLPIPAPDPDMDEEEQYRTRVAALCDVLGDDAFLLAIDNFEAVCEGAGRDSDLALVAELRERCPRLHVLIASRRGPLGLGGEVPYEVKPLAAEAAVELFRDRALDAGKMLLYAERTIVSEICELLDRVPLHIRMVSTRMRSDESPATILDGLRDGERRYPVAADAPPHYRSRELAFRYTYDHLDEHGQRLWAVMAGVFAGAPGRADVRAIYAHFKADLSLDALLLWSVVESVDGRHHMFESAREFGRARLMEGLLGEEEHNFRVRHAAYYLAYAEEHRDDCDAPARVLPDILAGFAFFAAQATRDEDGMRKYVSAVDGFLKAHGYWLQKRRWRQGIGK